MNKEVDYDPSISNIKLLKNSENDVNISNMNPSRISKPLSTKFNIDTTINNNMSNVDSSRNYGISNFHSSNSLQNSIKCITFPRSPRFNPNEENSPGFYKLPDINNKRGASIGYGKKFAFKDTADSPPPNKYFIKSKFTENVEKGKGCIIHPKLSYKFGVNILINII